MKAKRYQLPLINWNTKNAVHKLITVKNLYSAVMDISSVWGLRTRDNNVIYYSELLDKPPSSTLGFLTGKIGVLQGLIMQTLGLII